MIGFAGPSPQDDWRRLLDSQNQRCWICGSTFTEHRPPRVDHDPRTHEVRGALCQGCNRLLGQVDENVAWLRRAAAYLDDPPGRAVFDLRRHGPI